MQFLQESLIELITQTSTNLPPDVREAMGIMNEVIIAKQLRLPGVVVD